VAQFVDVLDVNAVVVALPSIGGDLGFSQANLQWVISAYVLFFAGFLLLAGRLADLWGKRRTFVAGLALFTGASLACGLSVSPEMLMIARAVQGLGAAITAPAALSIITTIFEEGPERQRAVAAWTAVAAGGGAVGLLLGGLITDVLGWQWVFLVNIPVGAAGVVLSYSLLPEIRGPRPLGDQICWGLRRLPRDWCSWSSGSRGPRKWVSALPLPWERSSSPPSLLDRS
jgi:MFS family permease